jgi:hypothetical protein
MSESVWVYCNNCKIGINHNVIHSQNYPISVTDNDGTTFNIGSETYQMIECVGCNTVSLQKITTSEDDYDPQTGNIASTYKYFPEREEGHD